MQLYSDIYSNHNGNAQYGEVHSKKDKPKDHHIVPEINNVVFSLILIAFIILLFIREKFNTKKKKRIN